MAVDFHGFGNIVYQSFGMMMTPEADDFQSMKALY